MVACAHYGGYVLGSDIDWSLAHGRGQYSLFYVFDISQNNFVRMLTFNNCSSFCHFVWEVNEIQHLRKITSLPGYNFH